MLWLLSAQVCVCVCVVLLCKSANTPRCQLADIKARESFFLLLCRRVEGLSQPFALSMVANRDRVGEMRGVAGMGWGAVRIVKPHVWQHVWHTITRAAQRMATHLFVTQNKMAVRPFLLISSWGRSPRRRPPSSPWLAPSHGLLYSRFSCAHREKSFKYFQHTHWNIFISKAKTRTHHVGTLMYFLCLCLPLLLPLNCARYIFCRGSTPGKILVSRQNSRGMCRIFWHHS